MDEIEKMQKVPDHELEYMEQTMENDLSPALTTNRNKIVEIKAQPIKFKQFSLQSELKNQENYRYFRQVEANKLKSEMERNKQNVQNQKLMEAFRRKSDVVSYKHKKTRPKQNQGKMLEKMLISGDT